MKIGKLKTVPVILLLTVLMSGLLLTACSVNEKEWVPISEHNELLEKNQALTKESDELESVIVIFKDRFEEIAIDFILVQGAQDELLKKHEELVSQNEKLESYFKNWPEITKSLKSSSDSIVKVDIVFTGPIEDFEHFYGLDVNVNVPPGFSRKDAYATHPWSATGRAVDFGVSGEKIVMARHALLGEPKNEFAINKFLTVTLTDPRGQWEYAIPTDSIEEFPELDLARFDIPPSLQITSIPLTNVDPENNPLAFYLYPTNNFSGWGFQIVGVGTIDPGMSASLLETKKEFADPYSNFISVYGRIRSGDSGSFLVIVEDGELKIIGFVLATVSELGHPDIGVAVKAESLAQRLTSSDSS